MMTPRSSSSGSFWLMCQAWSRLRLNVATRLSSITRRNSSSGWGPFLLIVRAAIPPPAVLTAMWSAPSAPRALSNAASTDASSITSHGWKVPPIPAATSAPADVGRSRIATSAPASRSASAVARAMPDAPPTTIARFPVISIRPFLLGSQRAGPYGAPRRGVDHVVCRRLAPYAHRREHEDDTGGRCDHRRIAPRREQHPADERAGEEAEDRRAEDVGHDALV